MTLQGIIRWICHIICKILKGIGFILVLPFIILAFICGFTWGAIRSKFNKIVQIIKQSYRNQNESNGIDQKKS